VFPGFDLLVSCHLFYFAVNFQRENQQCSFLTVLVVIICWHGPKSGSFQSFKEPRGVTVRKSSTSFHAHLVPNPDPLRLLEPIREIISELELCTSTRSWNKVRNPANGKLYRGVI
jgi:hypothetical protein